MIASSIWLPKNNFLSSILQLIHKTYSGGCSIWFCYLEVNLPLFFSRKLLCLLSFNLKHLFTHPSNKYLLNTVNVAVILLFYTLDTQHQVQAKM